MRLLVVCGLLLTIGCARPKPEPGVAVSGDPDQCAKSAGVQVWSRSTTGSLVRHDGPTEGMVIETALDNAGGPISIELRFITGQAAGAVCRWVFRDLADGEYVAFMATPDGSGGSQPFTIRDGSASPVTLRPPAVILTGQVVRAGAGLSGVIVRVTRLPFVRPPVVTTTDAEGRYRMALDAPGLFEVEAVNIGLEKTELTAGPNHVDVTASARANTGPPRPPLLP